MKTRKPQTMLRITCRILVPFLSTMFGAAIVEGLNALGRGPAMASAQIVRDPLTLPRLLGFPMDFAEAEYSTSDEAEGEANHRPRHYVVPKSVGTPTSESGSAKKEHSPFGFHYHEGRNSGVGSPSKLMMLNPDESSSNNPTPDDEEKFLQEIIAARRDAMRFRVRNSSELHIDNHNGNDEASLKADSKDPMQSVVVLPKPFHFHMPILAEPTRKKKGATEKQVLQTKKTATVSSTPAKKLKPKRGEQKDDSSSSDSDSHEDGLEFKRELATAKRETTEADKESLVVPSSSSEMPSSAVTDKSAHSLHEVKITMESNDNDRKFNLDLDSLLDQHPKLIPSVNRKRNSAHADKQDALDDESHHFLMVFGRDQSDDDVELPKDEFKITNFKREVKTVNFSQGLVDSILGHEDDFLKYHAKIKSHADKLGVQPEEIFHKVVYGNSTFNSNAKNATPIDLQQRRYQFQQLFLSDADESGKRHNEIIQGYGETENDNGNSKRYSAYMKVLKRERRGLKSWLKSIFTSKNKNQNAPESEGEGRRQMKTPSPPVPSSSRGRRKEKGRKKPLERIDQEADENGDTPVDLLLPKALRRSAYLKNRVAMESVAKEDEEIEAEYEKSEEKEIKTREADYYKESDSQENDSGKRAKSRKKATSFRRKRNANEEKVRRRPVRRARGSSTRSKRNVPEKLIPPVEGNLGETQPGEKLSNDNFSKDELLLVHEMLLNIINFRCNIPRTSLDYLLNMMQMVMDKSKLPDYLLERRGNVDMLFDQILTCSSDEENLSRWILPKKGTQPKVADLSEIPHKRTKRIRRQKRNAEKTTLQKNVIGKSATDEVASEENMPVTSLISRLVKLQVRMYKLILETCSETVDARLLQEVLLVMIDEMARGAQVQQTKMEIESFGKKVDISLVEGLFAECYGKKDLE